VPRSSTGIQAQRLAFGSEGGLGIVTRAVLQVWPLPEAQRYASFVFPDFEAGVRYLRAVQAAGVRPASIRLTNNTEFRLGQALGRARRGTSALVARLTKHYVTRVKRFDPERMVACTVVMEGSAAEVRQQARGLFGLLAAHGGLSGGPENGRRGYAVTFAIAYIRDFLNKLGILGETFETSAPWSRIHDITRAVEAELRRLCTERGVPGTPYLSYRISQSYRTGVCIYFTMGFCGRGLADAERTFHEIEHRMREVVLEQGGSLSHHHGVGKIRQGFVAQVHSEASIGAARALKRSLDPNDVFAAANHAFDPPLEAGSARRVPGRARRGRDDLTRPPAAGAFTDRVVLVTGASSGVGAALARAFAAEGADVVLFARSEADLERVADACRQTGRQALVVPGDVTRPEDCAAAVARTIERFGRLDTVVASAGLGMWARFPNEASVDQPSQIMNCHSERDQGHESEKPAGMWTM
jgi:FAD/FMN-containing dehydrogenase